jgi:ABC-type branched-subunit amino acid transport system ATPase component
MLLFADLHCSPKTLDICLQVLRDIHKKAESTNDSVGMLGDFFDTVYRRGTIPVDMLNTLLDFFAFEWKVPIVMIPGNHDYIDANETEHALDPFRHTSSQVMVIDKPTVINRVLWVPWRRNNDDLKAAFKQFEGEYDHIFGHFDVIGASVNSNVLSDRGLKPDDFPKPAITGHYHRPQKIGPVTYIGSPYQTSMSEAGQQKRIISFGKQRLLNVRVDYGPKRFKVTEDPDTWPACPLKAGDIVYMDCFTPEKLSREAQDWVTGLREKDITIVITRFLKDTVAANALLNSENPMSPVDMFKKYSEHFELEKEAGYDKALEMIHKLTKNDTLAVPTTLTFSSIEFEGFGPFVTHNAISLLSRGLTKVTGVWQEGQTGSSNGAGKSMATVSAFLWCLTGYSDMRASTSLKHSQANAACINHSRGHARVELKGFLGETPFTVTRSVSLTDKTNFLEFFFDSKRLTRSTQNMTQADINDTLFRVPKSKSLGKGYKNRLHAWLMRTMVWEQNGNNKSWLCDNDKGTKEELLMLCDMNVWEDLLATVGDELNVAETEYQSAKAMYCNARAMHETHVKHLGRLAKMKREWIELNRQKIDKYRVDITRYGTALDELGIEPFVRLKPENRNKRKHEEITKTYGALKHAKDISERKTKRFYASADEYAKDVETPEYNGKAPAPQNLHAAIEEMGIRKQQYMLLKEAASKPTKCPTCKQSLCVEHVPRASVEEAVVEFKTSQQVVVGEQKKVANHERQKQSQLVRDEKIQSWRQMVKAKNSFDDIEKKFEQCREEKNNVLMAETEWNSERMVHANWTSKSNEMVTCIRLLKQNVDGLMAEGNPIEEEEEGVKMMLTDTASAMVQYDEQYTTAMGHVRELQNIKQWCGTKGIQTYIVENILFKMSSFTTDWCKKLFDEQSQGSPVFTLEIGENEAITKTLQFGDSEEAKALSGGQFRRLQIAAFLAWRHKATTYTGVHTNLLLMDEPAANIDVIGFKQMEQALKDWCGEGINRTCMFISHEVDADKGSMMYDTHLEIRAKKGSSEVYDYDK